MLALLPHISPQTLDPFFLLNKELDRPYTEFGGWPGSMHKGFLPTGETAAFLIAWNNSEKRKEVNYILGKEHWFYKERMVWLDGQQPGGPWLSGRLQIADEILFKLNGWKYEPAYGASFPAKKLLHHLTGMIWCFPGKRWRNWKR